MSLRVRVLSPEQADARYALKGEGGSGGGTGPSTSIDDTKTTTTTVWSSSKTNSEITSRVNAVIAAAPSALDTLDELAAALGDDPNFATTVTNSIASRITGPSSSVSGNLMTFSGTTGKSAVDSGIAVTDLVRSSTAQTISGVKTFTTAPVVPDAAFAISKVNGLQSALDGKTTESFVTTSINNAVPAAVNTAIAPLRVIPLASATAAATLALDNARGMLSVNVSASANVTVPDNATVAFPLGTQVMVRQVGVGQVTLVPASGVTLLTSASLKTRTQHSVVMLVKVDTNTWSVSGDTE